MDVYYAARSKATLEGVCEALSQAFDLPPFEFDGHDTWRYAWSEGHRLRLNITRASNYCTVETWMPSCPSGVNFQVVLSTKAVPAGFEHRLAEVLGSVVTRYAESGEGTSD